MLLPAALIPAEEGGFTALNPETGSTSQGETIEEAVANLREATELYLEEFPLSSSGRSFITTFEVAVKPSLPRVSGREVIRPLEKLTFVLTRPRRTPVILRTRTAPP